MTTERERLEYRDAAAKRNTMSGEESENDTRSEDYSKPVAYDTEGRPLYAAPNHNSPQNHAVVHIARSAEPVKPELSEDVKRRHQESVERYPDLNLSEQEYVISAVRRHYIGLISPIAMTVIMISLVAALLISYPMMMESLMITTPPAFLPIMVIGLTIMALFAIGGYVAVWVYTNNRFFLTNESVIQEIQNSVFSHREQTVSLLNIEDASYTQHGILQNLLNYGSIRLSTEGDETTYRFDYVEDPKRQIAILNTAVEAFKNGRPVEGD